MKKDYLTIDEAKEIVLIAHSNEYTIFDQAEMISDIISYNDFKELWDNYTLYAEDESDEVKDLLLAVHAVFAMYNVGGFFDLIEEKKKKDFVSKSLAIK